MKLPPPFSWFYEAWMEFSQALGKVMSKVVLTILWIVGFGVYAIIRKLMRLFAPKKQMKTYWIDVPPADVNDLHRQF